MATWRTWREFEELALTDPVAHYILTLQDTLNMSPMQTLLQYAFAKHQQTEQLTQGFLDYINIHPMHIFLVKP